MLSIQIAYLRTHNNLSQAQLAKELNISPSALGMYEQGRRAPSLDILIKLSEYFHVSLDYLITGSDFTDSSKHIFPHTPEHCPCTTCFWKEYSKSTPSPED